jgi:glycosyltransferase involved in cell wall biosynthesis
MWGVSSSLSLSVVMPAHNEGEHIEQTVREWHATVVSRVPGSELIVVDDCSTDDTRARLEAARPYVPELRVVPLDANAGHGPAVRAGLEHAAGEYVFQTDSDRQFDPGEFWKLWALRQQTDFVFGVRQQRADGRFRAGISAMLRLTNLAVWGEWIADANCPFKLMRRAPLADLVGRIPRDSFIPMVMVSVLARRDGFRVAEVDVTHFPRTAGQQSLAGVERWARVGPRCVRELVALRLASPRRQRKPWAT